MQQIQNFLNSLSVIDVALIFGVTVLLFGGAVLGVIRARDSQQERVARRREEDAFLEELFLGADQGLTRFTPTTRQTSEN